MSIITSILHCYGLLISEESVTLMQQYILPLWEKTKPELYEMFSTKSDNDEFFDYLLDHYAIWSYVKKKYKLNTTNFLFLCNC